MTIYNDINRKLDELYQTIRPDDLSWIEDLRKTVSLFMKFERLKDFIIVLEYVKKELEKDPTKEDELKKIKGLLQDLQRSEPELLIERLRRTRFSIANDKGIKEAIEKQALRILEQTRLGKRDVVIGLLLRIFMVNKVPFPKELIEALKPKYDDNLFKAFIYAFLSAFITKED